MQREECYVAFLDILGFKSIIEKKPSIPEEIFRIIRDTRSQLEREKSIEDIDDEWPEMFNNMLIRIMSDSIVIAVAEKHRDSLAFVVYASSILQSKLLEMKILLRGGISKGWMCWDDEITYGAGMVKAYELENEACFPRIIIPGKVITEYVKLVKTSSIIYVTDYLLKDSDGWYYCKQYLNNADSDLASWVTEKLWDENTKDSVRDKYVWLRDKISSPDDEAEPERDFAELLEK